MLTLIQDHGKINLSNTERMFHVEQLGLNKKVLNKLTTEADRLYRALEDGDAYDDVQDFMDDVKGFLDNLVNVFEASGGRVDGLKYIEREEK